MRPGSLLSKFSILLLGSLLISSPLLAQERPQGPPSEMSACMKEQLGEPGEGSRPSKEDFEKAKKACAKDKTEGAVCEACEKEKNKNSSALQIVKQTQEILDKVADPAQEVRLEKKKDSIIKRISEFECDPTEDQKEDLKGPDKSALKKFAGHDEMIDEIKDAYRDKQKECKKLAQKHSRENMSPTMNNASGSAQFQQQLAFGQNQQQSQLQQYQMQQYQMQMQQYQQYQQYQWQVQMQQYQLQQQMQQMSMTNSMSGYGNMYGNMYGNLGMKGLNMHNPYGISSLSGLGSSTSGISKLPF